MLRIALKRGEDRRIRGGHPWIFSNEIAEIGGPREPGAVAEVFDAAGRYLGTGFYNPSSLIAVRLMSRTHEDPESPGYYKERIARALAYRQRLYPGSDSFRVLFSEADFLPGLVVDKYGDVLVVQFLSFGIDRRRNVIVDSLVELFHPRSIVARNDTAARKLEGLAEEVEVLYGEKPETVEIEENGLRLRVNVCEGQKTGHFFDQRENHQLLKEISNGRRVLDCFCYTGSWGLHAARFGAAAVTFLDVSARALELARQNAALNREITPELEFIAEDAFDRLRRFAAEGRRFDVVVMDPPAFVKSKKMLKEAEKGYLTINRRAMELLSEGGYLVTCSCSWHMTRENFREIAAKAAQAAGREMRLLHAGFQSPDHPSLLAVPETEYLKCLVLQAV